MTVDPMEIQFKKAFRETHNFAIKAAANVARMYEDESIAQAIERLEIEDDEPNHSSHLESNEAP